MKNKFLKFFYSPEDAGGGNPSGEANPQQDNTDYKALYEKAKAEKDKASKEASDYKKALREKQTDEEKKAELDAEKQRQIEEIIRENKTLKLTNALSKDNVLSNDEITQIVNARYGDSDSDFATVLLKIINDKLTSQKDNLLKEFKRNPKVPSGSSSGANGNGDNEIVELAKNVAKQTSQNNTKKYGSYFKQKD